GRGAAALLTAGGGAVPTGMPLHRVVNVRANLGRAVQAYRAYQEQRPRRADPRYLDQLAQRLADAAAMPLDQARRAGHGAGARRAATAEGRRLQRPERMMARLSYQRRVAHSITSSARVGAAR